MWKLVWREFNSKYWRFDAWGIIVKAVTGIITAYFYYITHSSSGLSDFILAVLAGTVAVVLLYTPVFAVVLVRRIFNVGFLRFNIAYRNGIANDCICVNIESAEIREHNTDLHFNCYGRFLRVWDAKTNETIIPNHTHSLSFAPQINSGKSFQYGNIPDGDNVIYFAKVENGKLVFFTTATKLISLDSGTYNVDIVLGGICKELDKCIRPVKFKGRVHFDGVNARLEYRKWLTFPSRKVAEQSVHPTSGIRPAKKAVSKPKHKTAK